MVVSPLPKHPVLQDQSVDAIVETSNCVLECVEGYPSVALNYLALLRLYEFLNDLYTVPVFGAVNGFEAFPEVRILGAR